MAYSNGADTHPLLELLVDGIQCVLDRNAFEVPCCYFEPEREVEVNLLDWWCCEELLEVFLVFYRRRRRVDLPVKVLAGIALGNGWDRQ
jgi:hypothetical protein